MQPLAPIINLEYKGNKLSIDLKKGGKILELSIKDQNGVPHKIISGNSEDLLTSNGSFLMYPWVNRLESPSYPSDPAQKIIPEFCDGKGLSLHGLFASCEREILEQAENYVRFKVKDFEAVYQKNQFSKAMPKFVETFVLTEEGLSVCTEFLAGDQDSEGFSYGYHPYIQLDENEINGVILQTNMSHYIKLDERQIPIASSSGQYQLGNIKEIFENNVLGKEISLDDCFVNDYAYLQKENYFNFLFKEQKLGIFINDSDEVLMNANEKIKELIMNEEKIPLKYFQLYTPGDRKRISVEPQSSGANSFNIQRNDLVSIKKGGKSKYGLFNILLKKI